MRRSSGRTGKGAQIMGEELHQDSELSAGNDEGGPRTERLARRALMLGAAAGAGVAVGMIAGADPAEAATAGRAVLLGKSNKATATTTVSTTKGNGLEGQTSAGGRSGLYGSDTSRGGGYGVSADSIHGTGVYGASSAEGGSGVVGFGGVGGTSGTGVTGQGTFAGVYGLTNNQSQYGVYGEASGAAKEAFGVYGLASGEDATGVWGQGAYIGTAGVCTGSEGIGVFASASADESSTALSVGGNASITGLLSKGAGSFKIDHPLDPAHKYLYHSFVESPDMMNVYNGTVALNRDGQARVELPDWFEALNRDFRYQLTAVGAPAPNLHISSKVADGAFSIAGGNEGQEVSWQVTGIRQDAFANAHRIVVEVDKPAEDHGRYLHPELFGKGDEQIVTALAKARSYGCRQASTVA
jgi:hypothetical protein